MQAFNTAKRRKSPAPRRLRLPRTDDTVPYCASLPVLIRRRINGAYPVAERNQDARALGNDERRLSRRLGGRAVKRLALRARAREDLLLRSGRQESRSDHSHYTGGRGVLDGVRRWASCAQWSNINMLNSLTIVGWAPRAADPAKDRAFQAPKALDRERFLTAIETRLPETAPGRECVEHALEVRGVSLRFGGVRALTEVSFGVNDGELFSIIGR